MDVSETSTAGKAREGLNIIRGIFREIDNQIVTALGGAIMAKEVGYGKTKYSGQVRG